MVHSICIVLCCEMYSAIYTHHRLHQHLTNSIVPGIRLKTASALHAMDTTRMLKDIHLRFCSMLT